MKVLVIGRGGREHVLCEKIKASSLVKQVFVAPGNVAMASVAELLPYNELDQEQLIAFAQEQEIDLVFIGPEQPLVEGLADRFRKAQIRVFAPSKQAAKIEGSKTFAKEIMQKYGIPTARYGVFRDYDLACAYLEQCSIPVVIKADGLAAGKGVVVAQTRLEAKQALQEMLVEEKFGVASEKVIIEEYLAGEEFSLMALVHGETVIPLEVVQDHKRAYDGDLGPNTGGMGAYSPVSQIDSEVVKTAVHSILEVTARALSQEGLPFTGVLYAGLILTADGPQVIEFNARLGDPETQVLLPRLESDLVEVVLQLMAGEKPELIWSSQAMVGVVVASEGYPEKCVSGTLIKELSNLNKDLRIYYGAVARNTHGQLISTGGRILLVGALGKTLQEAQEKVYRVLHQLNYPGLFYRTDIGNKGIIKAVSL